MIEYHFGERSLACVFNSTFYLSTRLWKKSATARNLFFAPTDTFFRQMWLPLRMLRIPFGITSLSSLPSLLPSLVNSLIGALLWIVSKRQMRPHPRCSAFTCHPSPALQPRQSKFHFKSFHTVSDLRIYPHPTIGGYRL